MTDGHEHVPTVLPTTTRPRNDDTSIDDDTSRLDAVEKVTGRARYGRDRVLDEMLWVGFIRCPWGAATLEGVDTAAARAVPGVVEIEVTGDAGRYHGHNVGYVVAESRHALRRGLRAAAPRWKRGAVTTQIADSAGDPPPATEATAKLLADADHVIEAMYETPVQTHSALETHGAVVDHRGDEATVYASTQGTFSTRDGLGEALGLPAASYEVRCEYVGGGFGAKLRPGKEGVTAAAVARKHGRPVRLFVERDEEHLDTGNRPSSRSWVRYGFKRDGTLLGGQVHTWGGVGVGRGGGGVAFPSRRYDLGTVQAPRRGENVSFNGGAPRAMRAPGHPQGAFAEELLLDEVATMAGIDPVALRIRADVDDDRKAMYELGARLIGWGERLETGSQTGVVRRGFGVGSASWGRFRSGAEAEVAIHPDGSVEARTGTQDIGQGQRTVMGVVTADQLGVPLRMVKVAIGSTRYPVGPGSGGSVTAHTTAPPMMAAADDAKSKLLERVAERLACDASELDVVDGVIRRGDAPAMSWADACRALPAGGITGRGDAETGRAYDGEGHSNGVQFVDLEVDAETGVICVRRIVAIQSCGRVAVRKLAESQIIGGVIQGLSFGLFENKLLDRQTGAMVNPNLEMYKIAGTVDMPLIEPVLWTRGQTGVRSLGEPPVIPTAAAIACGVFNAIGRPVRSLPLTPDKVLAALKGGGA